MSPFLTTIITQGNAPLLTDTLLDLNGNVVDLSGCTLEFSFQGASVSFTQPGVVGYPAAAGGASYLFRAGETDVAGDYQGQWRVTKTLDGSVTLYPLGGVTLPFKIVEALPQASPSNIVLIRQMFEPVRCVLGDFSKQFQKYSDDAISSVLRTCLMTGKVPLQSLTPDRNGITPGIVLPSDLALLMYHAAKMFLLPNIAEYRYQTRALSEKFGSQLTLWFELNNAIYELENGEMFSSFQSFYAWVNALTGIDIWSVMSDMTIKAPVATVSIGRAGVTVATS